MWRAWTTSILSRQLSGGGRQGTAENVTPRLASRHSKAVFGNRQVTSIVSKGDAVGRFVIDVGVALRITEDETEIAPSHTLLAPTLLRSQVLDVLFSRVRNDELSKEVALDLNARFGKLKVRYLGDAVLRRRAWALAERAGMASTFQAEYLALTQLQADALVTEDDDLTSKARGIVTVKPFVALLG